MWISFRRFIERLVFLVQKEFCSLEVKNSRSQEFKKSRIQESKNSRIQELKKSSVGSQEARMHYHCWVLSIEF
jgi:azurin